MIRRILYFGLLGSLLAVAFLLLAGPGYRAGIWPLPIGLSLVRASGWVGLAALLILGVSLGLTSNGRLTGLRRKAFAGLAVSLAVTTIALSWKQKADALPRIHDISTDTENPPAFVTALSHRTQAVNSTVYGGPAVAAAQHEAYPDLAPVLLPLPRDRAFNRALKAARDSGWKLLEADAQTGRIEATDTTLWFGFKDDVVIRVEPAGNGSRVDVRSVSRVGKGDFGTNAKRIRAYLKRLSKEEMTS